MGYHVLLVPPLVGALVFVKYLRLIDCFLLGFFLLLNDSRNIRDYCITPSTTTTIADIIIVPHFDEFEALESDSRVIV